MLEALSATEPSLRQCAAYGVKVAASLGAALFKPLCNEVWPSSQTLANGLSLKLGW
jgi:hypothetical protein